MNITKRIKMVVVYYLSWCGLCVNGLAIGLYFYNEAFFYIGYEKAFLAVQRLINPDALSDKKKYVQGQLANDIAANFGQWRPLPVTELVVPGTINIGGTHYKTLAAANADLQEGQAMVIGAGTYLEPLVIKQNNVKILGSGLVVFDGVSAEGKAAIITKGKQITIINIECKNIAVADKNGSCIRSEGAGLTVEHVYFHDSEQGILSSGNQFMHIIDSRFEKLGKNGRAHGIYIDAGELIIDNSLFIASMSEGHEVKSRASKTVIKNSVIASLASTDSRLIDVPNGGELIVSDSVLEKGPQSANATAIGYGLEGIKHSQNSVVLEKNVIILERDRHNQLLDVRQKSQVPVRAVGNIIVSKDNVDIDGFNWLYANRQEAKMEDYPKLPVLENSQK